MREGLRAAYPNPFNPHCTVRYALVSPGWVRLSVHDIRGRRVCDLVDGHREAGLSEAVWKGRDDRGRRVASGIYILRFESGECSQSEKLVLLR